MLGPLLSQLAGIDPQAAVQLAIQAEIHIEEILRANARLKLLVEDYQARIAEGRPLMTDEERQALKDKIAADSQRYRDNDPARRV